jgi:hypothetical protein
MHGAKNIKKKLSCELGNEASSYIKDDMFLGHPSDC